MPPGKGKGCTGKNPQLVTPRVMQPSQHLPSPLGPRKTTQSILGTGVLSPSQREAVLPTCVVLLHSSLINICRNAYSYVYVVFLKAPGLGGNWFSKNPHFREV